ncbi:MAG: TIGR03936 family radical SAM-associated protein [Oscillospiraceae bacterium]
MINARLYFSKTFSARYMSHLDLMRCFTRAVRCSGLPVWYTEGFNSHLYITFAMPLSLGCESICETADIRLLADNPEPYMAQKINEGLPFGVEVFDAREAVMKPSMIAFARYLIELEDSELDGQELTDRLRELIISPLMAQKHMKKGGLREVCLNDGIESSEIYAAGGRCFADLLLAADSEHSVNPSLVLRALFDKLGREPEHQLVKRTQILTADRQNFV